MSKLKAGWTSNTLELLAEEDTNNNPVVPCNSFKLFNRCVGNPVLPATGELSDVFDYQEDYEKAWNKYHKLILNKSRKIGATETALRIIAYNCFNGTYESRHRIMIVAGNKQTVANRFLERFKNIFGDGFTDLNGQFWSTAKVLTKEMESKGWKLLFQDQKSGDKLKLCNGITLQAYPANESVRGEENVICVFMSECAFINLLDDSKVYNALHPNVANIGHADFIMESTPNGKRGFFWKHFTQSDNEYHKLEQPYTVSMGNLLDEETIEAEKHNPDIDFEQEYCCKFTTSLSSVFKEEDVKFEEKQINTYDDL